MYRSVESYRNVRLVATDDPEYLAFIQRIRDRRPSRGGPRAAGEYLGGLVEQCVRHWLSGFVPLQEERILTWEQRLRNGRHGTLFREIDGVWKIDDESYCLYEMKLTFPENMERGTGLRQLDASAETLFADKRVKYVLKRLVYISEEPITVLPDEPVPVLEPNDEFEELGVIWVKPESVLKAASELEITLPENWLEPESREGAMEDPEREEWRQWADTEPAKEEAGETEELPSDNPLADALRRAMENN